MNKYEYRMLEETAVKRLTLDDLNELGEQGWRVVSWMIPDGGYECVLLERVITMDVPSNDGSTPNKKA